MKIKSKKGTSIIMMIAEVLAVTLVLTLVYQAVIRVSTEEGITTINIANEVGMGVEALTSLNGNLVIELPYQNLSGQIFLLSSTDLTVRGKATQTKYNINLPQGYTATGFVEKTERVCLEKIGQTIYLRGCQKNEQ